MNANQAIKKMSPDRGLTGIIAPTIPQEAPSVVGGEPIISDANLSSALREAETQLKFFSVAQKNSGNDDAWWGYESDISYWKSVINILKAAKISPNGILPDIPYDDSPSVVMDVCARQNRWGLEILDAAKSLAEEKPKTKEFEREPRYYVIKASDYEAIKDQIGDPYHQVFMGIGGAVNHNRASRGKEPLECVVIESDWRCYEQVWRMAELEHNQNQAAKDLPENPEHLEILKAIHSVSAPIDKKLKEAMDLGGYDRAIQIACNEWELMMQRDYNMSAHMPDWLRSMADTIEERGFA